MFKYYVKYLLLFIVFIMSACSPTYVEKPTLQNTIENVVKNDKNSSKNTIVTKTKECIAYEKSMNHAINYINREFKAAYFSKKDLLGAKAQVYLVENKSSSIFAKNINKANDKYIRQYKLAKKKSCSLDKFSNSAMSEVNKKISFLEKTKL